jgi:L-ascorbate metabolism protein UlaG (beta-lactamase superfamily)
MTLSIKWLSKYSWFKIETENKVIHIDPGYAGYLKNQGIPVSEFKDKADLVLVTHFHKDHLQPEALSKIRKSKTIILAPEKCSDRIIGDFQIVKPGDELKIDDVTVKVVNAYNTPEGNSTRKLHHKGDSVGYLITIDSHKFYHAGDTDFIPEMHGFGEVDVALLPIGGIFTMDIDEAVKAANIIKPKIIIPMHRRDADPNQFKEKVEINSDKLNKSTINVLPLGIGEIYQLKY